jgi:hypothetical protein
VPDPLLDIRDDLAGIGLVPMPVQLLGHQAHLHDKIAGEVLRLDFAAFFPPKPDESGFICTHDDPGVRATDEVAVVLPSYASQSLGFHGVHLHKQHK